MSTLLKILEGFISFNLLAYGVPLCSLKEVIVAAAHNLHHVKKENDNA